MTKRKGMKTPVSSNRIDGGMDESHRGLILLGLGRNFEQLLNRWLDKKFYKKPQSGMILLLMAVVIPVLLLGTKYVLDQRTLSTTQVEDTLVKANKSEEDGNLVKSCAQKAALAVAEKWNPAMTYKQQKETMLRIADEIYNNTKPHVNRITTRALPGVDVSTKKFVAGEGINPIAEISMDDGLKPEDRIVDQKEVAKTNKRYYRSNGTSSSYDWYKEPSTGFLCRVIHTSLLNAKCSLLSTDDWLYDVAHNYSSNEGPGEIWFTLPNEATGFSYSGSSSAPSTGSYKTRTNPNDPKVQIECEGDKIKVKTDRDVGFAIPAECNVDIVLAVPINSAACNPNNYDSHTPTTETPYISNSTTPTDEAKKTPIHQITRAYKEFLKNFFYTRGVNVGVIPYSGNVSIESSKKATWTKDPDPFVATEFFNGEQPTIVGAMLYGTKGIKNSDLTTMGTVAGSYACGLLCRGQSLIYKGNTLTVGDLLSTTNPANYKFRRQVYNPCYITDANLLSMKCEKDGRKYWINPYYILELNPNVKFIYEMMNAFFPYYDDQNVSNFIFIPVTWANNLFQEWAKASEQAAVDTKNDSTNLGRLKTPSSREQNRKKALILVINKPDWFEPEELTYLGFDNDYSEVPMIESDCIRGDIDYSDTTQKFADGTYFNTGENKNSDGSPLIAGQKKILKIEKVSGDDIKRENNGYLECVNGTHRLKFPQKGTVKLVVAPSDGISQNTNGGSGSIKFYHDHITEAHDLNNKDIKIKGTNEDVPLDTDIPVSGTKTFVFAGGHMPNRSNSRQGTNSTQGVNFAHNLCVKKVRYAISNATITNCVLKNQIIRDYEGLYGYYVPHCKRLMLNDETKANRCLGEQSYGYGSSDYGYAPYATYATIRNNDCTSVSLNTDCDMKISKFRDSCIKYTADYMCFHSVNYMFFKQTFYLNILVYGISQKFFLSMCFCNNSNTCYYNGSNAFTSSGHSNSWGSRLTIDTGVNSDTTSLTLGSGILEQYYIQNTIDKTLQNKYGPLISNPIIITRYMEGNEERERVDIYDDLDKNKGVYLSKFVNSDNETENWICFQGDAGEGGLEVTVSNHGWIGFNDNDQTEITEQEETVFSSDQLKESEDGHYYIDLDMTNIRLISAQITCPTKAVEKYYAENQTVADVIDFSNGNKTSKNTLVGKSTQVLSTNISGSNNNGLYQVFSHENATITSEVKGSLKLLVYPVINSGKVILRKGSNDTEGKTYTVTAKTEIEVPAEYLIPDPNDSTKNRHILTLDLTDVFILNTTLTNWNPRFDNIPRPERSQVVDFSKNENGKPFYDPSLMVYGKDNSGTFGERSIIWDDYLKSWTTHSDTGFDTNLHGKSAYNHFNYQQVRGDFYYLLDDIGTAASKIFVWDKNTTIGNYSQAFISPGLTRKFLPLQDQEDTRVRFDIYNINDGAKSQFVMAGATLPVNLTLFANAYQPDYNPMAAVKRVTKAAIEKLASDWKSNLSIYIITFRKQGANADYSYLSNCNVGSSRLFIYDVPDSNDAQSVLEGVLNTIAEDIKTEAKYKEVEVR